MKDINVLLNIQNNKRKSEFYSYFKDYFEFVKLIKFLLNINMKKDKYICLHNIAWILFCELSGRNFGEEQHFYVSTELGNFQEYMYSWDRLWRMDVPFHEWEDLSEEGINLLKELIDNNELINFKENGEYKIFIKKFVQRHENLRLNKGYKQLDELMAD